MRSRWGRENTLGIKGQKQKFAGEDEVHNNWCYEKERKKKSYIFFPSKMGDMLDVQCQISIHVGAAMMNYASHHLSVHYFDREKFN